MAIQRTLSIIKPDAVAKNVVGEIISRFEKNNLKNYSKFNQLLKENGVFKPIGKMYISLSLTEDDFSQTEFAIEKAASEIRN